MKKMNFKTIYSTIFIVSFLLSVSVFNTSCEYETIEPVTASGPSSNGGSGGSGGSGGDGSDSTSTVFFAADIIPIFNDHCISCHDPGPLDLSSTGAYSALNDIEFVDVSSPSSSLLYTTLSTGHLDNAEDEDYAKILTWIEEGALNN